MVAHEAGTEWQEKSAKDKALGGPSTHRVGRGRWFRGDGKKSQRSPEEGGNAEARERQHLKTAHKCDLMLLGPNEIRTAFGR